jgi:hypothetical protein
MTGTALEGLRVAQVRVIFDCPLQVVQGTLRSDLMPIQLAYVEWFKPFRQLDQLTNMFILSRATRSGAPIGKVVPLERIVGSIHLLPRFGTHVDPCLSHESVVEECKSFYFNKWITPHTFYQL